MRFMSVFSRLTPFSLSLGNALLVHHTAVSFCCGKSSLPDSLNLEVHDTRLALLLPGRRC